MAQNQLIESLPAKDRDMLLGVCEEVPLVLGCVLCEPGEATRHVYFPVDGFISMVALHDGKPALEVGMVGREGMLGVQLVLAVPTAPLHAVVQGSGSAWRADADAFGRVLVDSVALRRVLERYLYVLMAQLAGAAACIRFHEIGPRLARWLLMSQDRAHADRFHVTHEFLAYMLGVRRVGITGAASAMQRSGLIEYRRGEMAVLDRSALEAAACACYASETKTYGDVLGTATAPLPARVRRKGLTADSRRGIRRAATAGSARSRSARRSGRRTTRGSARCR
jgi:CRP-like cAMP-binding protein